MDYVDNLENMGQGMDGLQDINIQSMDGVPSASPAYVVYVSSLRLLSLL